MAELALVLIAPPPPRRFAIRLPSRPRSIPLLGQRKQRRNQLAPRLLGPLLRQRLRLLMRARLRDRRHVVIAMKVHTLPPFPSTRKSPPHLLRKRRGDDGKKKGNQGSVRCVESMRDISPNLVPTRVPFDLRPRSPYPVRVR